MKLEGTLDAFGLPDVLQLLGFTRKTGALRLTHGTSTGEVLVRDGLVTGIDADGLARLLLWDAGDFAFDGDALVPDGVGVSHTELIEAATAVAAQWRSGVSALPADSTVLVMAASIDAPVTLDVEQWGLLAHIDGKRTVGVLCSSLEDRLRLAGLVEQGLVEEKRAAFVAPEPRVPVTPFSTSMTVPSFSSSGGYGVVGSLAMKPDVLLAPAPAPGIHDILLKRLVVGIRGL